VFFLGLREIQNMKSTLPVNRDFKEITRPIYGRLVNGWMQLAATVVLLVGLGFLLRQYQVRQEKVAQEQAYIEVMEAFALLQQNLQQGERQLEVMQDLKYLHTAHQLLNLNERKND